MCMSVPNIYICILHMCRSQKRVLGTLEMEILKVVSCCVGVNNRTQVFCKNS